MAYVTFWIYCYGWNMSVFSHHFGPHDDVIKWKYFRRHWPFVRGIHWSTVSSQRPVTCSFDVFFDLSLIKRLSDLRRHCAHYDVTVILNPRCPAACRPSGVKTPPIGCWLINPSLMGIKLWLREEQGFDDYFFFVKIAWILEGAMRSHLAWPCFLKLDDSAIWPWYGQ